MNLVQFANFIRVVELRSVSKAAAMVHLAQPALSRQIRALEVELGVALLDRHGWGVTPTPAGEAFAAEARKVLRAVDTARDTVLALATEPAGPVALGMPMSLAPVLIPPLSAILRARYPALRPHFIDGAGLDLHKRLLAGELDLAILYDDRGLGPVVTTPLLTEPLVLVGPPGAVIDPKLSSGHLVRSLPLILPSRPNRHRLLVDQIAAEGPANVVVEVEANAAIMAMIEAEQGFTVSTYSGVAAEIAKGRAAAFLLRNPIVSRTLVLARLAERQLATSIEVVATELQALVHVLAGKMKWRPLSGNPGSDRGKPSVVRAGVGKTAMKNAGRGRS